MERGGRTRSSGEPGTGNTTRDAATSPGKSTLTASLPVQMKQATSAPLPGTVQEAAAHGTQAPATAMPHADKIQAAFGPDHDVSAIKAHVGGPAAQAACDMGATAYATGSHAVFANTPDQHTAAHEAAHVVQQAKGVNLYGGVGTAGDAYERHADAVADRVVAGQSAADMLGGPAGAKDDAVAAVGPVQKKEGKVTHDEAAGSGKVTARENDFDPSDKTQENYSLEYAGKDADDAHWLQFINVTMIADVPGTGKVYNTGTVPTTGGAKPYSDDKVKHWGVDSVSKANPYYDSAASNQRTPGKATKIFDMPGGPTWAPFAQDFVDKKQPKATKVTVILAFDTYLCVKDKAIHHVEWSGTTEYDPAKKTTGAIAYATGGGGAAAGVPKEMKTALDAQYAGNKIT
jgi:hypothetical protein